MSVDKKETVTAFQACTGIEDVLLAILYLEDAKWDLSAAIQRMVLPEYKVFPKRPLKPRNKLPVNPNPIDPTRIVKYKQVALKPIRCRYLKFVVSFEDKLLRTYDAFWNLKWYTWSKENRKLYFLLMTRIKCTESIFIGLNTRLNRNSLIQYVKITYAIMACLYQTRLLKS
ncbi:hypothetical protein GWI33_013554 [Rhynchophorus ferrugineus]|uniref:Uncharacterized protein n=1 Tax=Rhynchophorus ferrugineus TaxID=354439 RepID=A0A834MBG3_RHYFE|nr:hypothetical protein GWI33_013554 [Rhynchophorus ferrugineus]